MVTDYFERFNHLNANAAFPYPLKTSESQRFSNVFKGNKYETLVCNDLRTDHSVFRHITLQNFLNIFKFSPWKLTWLWTFAWIWLYLLFAVLKVCCCFKGGTYDTGEQSKRKTGNISSFLKKKTPNRRLEVILTVK